MSALRSIPARLGALAVAGAIAGSASVAAAEVKATKVDFGPAYGNAVRVDGGDVWSDNLKDASGKPLVVHSTADAILACERLIPQAALPTEAEFMAAERRGVFKVLPNVINDNMGYMTSGSYNTRYFYDRAYAFRGNHDSNGKAREPEVWLFRGMVVFEPARAYSDGSVRPGGLYRTDNHNSGYNVRCVHRASGDQRPKQQSDE